MVEASSSERERCELCEDPVTCYVLTSESHSEGANILVGLWCCAEGT